MILQGLRCLKLIPTAKVTPHFTTRDILQIGDSQAAALGLSEESASGCSSARDEGGSRDANI